MSDFVMEHSLRKSFSIQCRVIGALLMREIITRYGRHNIGVLWLIVEPMLFTLGVATLWHLAKLHVLSNIPIIAFAITGYSSVLIWRNATSHCSKAIEPNLALMYHRNVKVIDIFASRVILEIIGATASFTILTVFFASVGAMQWPQDLIPVFGGWFLLCWFAFAFGFIVGALSERTEAIERTWHIVTYLLFPLSGAVFMVHWLPEGARDALLWLPMVHGVEMIRHGFFGNIVPTYEDPGYFATVNALTTLIGLILVRECGRRVQPE
ncbi:ABC transporter permease [Pelomicrobium methylotrophicum]|uniref:ABC transporter permease n=1 Tax=Pelomicrobium methylotrophicum TaxID=2602750 RepID=A0A5C7EV67_9PROT|nr:ABC transporter permease [Pelomicrobium methylotrophicum]TXF10926.1 ABC transporter permease [Pelomicrobium methylotrophicum]